MTVIGARSTMVALDTVLSNDSNIQVLIWAGTAGTYSFCFTLDPLKCVPTLFKSPLLAN